MKTFLRDLQSGLYLRSRGTWTSDPQMALDFKRIIRAVEHAERTGLQGVELVVASPGSPQPTALDVGLTHPGRTNWHD